MRNGIDGKAVYYTKLQCRRKIRSVLPLGWESVSGRSSHRPSSFSASNETTTQRGAGSTAQHSSTVISGSLSICYNSWSDYRQPTLNYHLESNSTWPTIQKPILNPYVTSWREFSPSFTTTVFVNANCDWMTVVLLSVSRSFGIATGCIGLQCTTCVWYCRNVCRDSTDSGLVTFFLERIGHIGRELCERMLLAQVAVTVVRPRHPPCNKYEIESRGRRRNPFSSLQPQSS